MVINLVVDRQTETERDRDRETCFSSFVIVDSTTFLCLFLSVKLVTY